MKKEIVEPLNNKKENFYVVVVVFFILLFSITLVLFTRSDDTETKLKVNEISSFENFNTIENNIYSDLYNYSVELENFALNEGFEDIDKLNKEGVYPFVKDELWESKGKFNWFKVEKDGYVYYIGISGDKTVGNFILKSRIVNNTVENNIYYLKKKLNDTNEVFDNITEFKEVKSLTGSDINNGKEN